ENRPSVIGRPAAVLDVFGTASDQVRPRLADRKNFHGPVFCHITGCSRSATCIVQFTPPSSATLPLPLGSAARRGALDDADRCLLSHHKLRKSGHFLNPLRARTRLAHPSKSSPDGDILAWSYH